MIDSATSPTPRFEFGPSLLPTTTQIERQSTAAVSFYTTYEAAEHLLPYHYVPTSEPVVSVTFQDLDGIDYMHGRGYRLVNVAISAEYRTVDGELLVKPCPVVIWESNTTPIIAGRELHGNPKIYGNVSALETDGPDLKFSVREYESTIVTGRITDREPFDSTRLDRVNRSSSGGSFFGWKFVPGLDGTPDVDYPTLIRGSATYTRAWTGVGELDFGSSSAAETPFSFGVLEVLRALPNLGYRRAFYGTGSARLYRDKTQRLR